LAIVLSVLLRYTVSDYPFGIFKLFFLDSSQGNSTYTATMLSKEKVIDNHKYKQRSTKHTYKTKDRVTRTPLKTGVNSDLFLSLGNHRNICADKNDVVGGVNEIVITTNGAYPW
jgi:hypothetical protein